ncbi:DUF2218 domain-containing protein [Azotobacter beijerinckii]|uniref:DUF2218 domain-containing protein n=1 Tax=Azotobacter beijerinckii TaxID=170623 RepID=A0A1I4D966_9GAMM|nr:DUF2218 domain-containing protein [Azotobacter beijerinckii]SFB33770.1 hypothetical protein SAMN04244571_02301 [Azotobacter beijerinckii]SFK89419.1 hypothetical protein SAMN04244574_02277 [Azotobacter beijerinckii]
MRVSSARVATQDPARLIRRLCKHWAHKFPVSFDERQGEIQLPPGRCLLQAGDGQLEVRLQASDAEQIQRLQQVVAEHLQRMAGDETLDFAWSDGEPGGMFDSGKE